MGIISVRSASGYFRMHAYRRVESLADTGSFEEWDKEMEFSNPLSFPGYEEKMEGCSGAYFSEMRLLSQELLK